MKIILACDVDPILPPVLRSPPRGDVWESLDGISALMDVMGADVPPITWFIRSDESVRFATGDFASGYVAKRQLWESLRSKGHELGWHVHLLSFNSSSQCFEFDEAPNWLADAHMALSQYFDARATRTGWDYANNALFNKFESLGVCVDMSALPGNIVWQKIAGGEFTIDWLRCVSEPYHPDSQDYQRAGNLKLLEIPITQFSNTTVGILKRTTWRLWNGCYSFSGIGHKTKLLTTRWDTLPTQREDQAVWAFYFHADELSESGIENFRNNIRLLQELPAIEFVTAAAARDALVTGRRDRSPTP